MENRAGMGKSFPTCGYPNPTPLNLLGNGVSLSTLTSPHCHPYRSCDPSFLFNKIFISLIFFFFYYSLFRTAAIIKTNEKG